PTLARGGRRNSPLSELCGKVRPPENPGAPDQASPLRRLRDSPECTEVSIGPILAAQREGMRMRLHPSRVRWHHVVALLTILGGWWISPHHALAQLPGDLIVTITSPTSGSTVAATITVSASVSPVGVVVGGVQFKLDGGNLGAEDTSAPYAVSWNTTGASNGSHTLVAIARDALGLTYASSPVSVTVSNAPPPDTGLEAYVR